MVSMKTTDCLDRIETSLVHAVIVNIVGRMPETDIQWREFDSVHLRILLTGETVALRLINGISLKCDSIIMKQIGFPHQSGVCITVIC